MQPIELTSKLDAPAGRVWERISTFEGVNDELRPLLRMTAPRHLRTLDPADVHLGERIFRSWVLLFGLLPVDYDDLTLIARSRSSRGGCRVVWPPRSCGRSSNSTGNEVGLCGCGAFHCQMETESATPPPDPA